MCCPSKTISLLASIWQTFHFSVADNEAVDVYRRGSCPPTRPLSAIERHQSSKKVPMDLRLKRKKEDFFVVSTVALALGKSASLLVAPNT